mmetsp:Transcript_27487/g.37687  ORF Transcript_27487/g.37687 Transcript_27487/m.37687 type:complete len:213 (+) Transcript_27487:401-1039(+)
MTNHATTESRQMNGTAQRKQQQQQHHHRRRLHRLRQSQATLTMLMQERQPSLCPPTRRKSGNTKIEHSTCTDGQRHKKESSYRRQRTHHSFVFAQLGTMAQRRDVCSTSSEHRGSSLDSARSHQFSWLTRTAMTPPALSPSMMRCCRMDWILLRGSICCSSASPRCVKNGTEGLLSCGASLKMCCDQRGGTGTCLWRGLRQTALGRRIASPG